MAKRVYEEDAMLSDALAAAIGHLVHQWGHLEDGAGLLTALLLGSDYYDFRGVSSNLATASKFDALASVARLTLPKRQAATIVQIAERAKRLSGERNRIIHGSWYPTRYPSRNPDTARRYTYSAKVPAGLKQSNETVSAARIRSFTAEVAALRRRLNHALSRAGFYRRDQQTGQPASP